MWSGDGANFDALTWTQRAVVRTVDEQSELQVAIDLPRNTHHLNRSLVSHGHILSECSLSFRRYVTPGRLSPSSVAGSSGFISNLASVAQNHATAHESKSNDHEYAAHDEKSLTVLVRSACSNEQKHRRRRNNHACLDVRGGKLYQQEPLAIFARAIWDACSDL